MQEHVLLLFMFPEYDSEYSMAYTRDQLTVAKQDAANFHEMYPGVLYVKVVFVFENEREECLYSWINPLSAKLINLANSAGGAMSTFPMSLASANPAGDFFQKLSKRFSDTRLSLRPPSEEAYAAPLPSASKIYGGRKQHRPTHRGRNR